MTFVPTAIGGTRADSATSPRWSALVPGSFRVLLGLVLCLPGGLVIALGALLLWPGYVLVASGFRCLVAKVPAPYRPTLRPRPNTSLSWTAERPMRAQ